MNPRVAAVGVVVLLAVVGIFAILSWITGRGTAPAASVAQIQPTAPPLPTSTPEPAMVPCGNGTYAYSLEACDAAKPQPPAAVVQPAPTQAPVFVAPTQAPPPPPPPTTAPPPPQANTSSVTLQDGHRQAGSQTVSLSGNQAIVGQSYEVNGQGGGCKVFGGNGPTTVNVVDGEWWVFDQTLSNRDLNRLMDQAQQNQENDPQAQCSGGSDRINV